MLVIFGCTLILVFLIRYHSNKQDHVQKKSANEFRLHELEALTARKQDISGLPYLTADSRRLPVITTPDEECTERLAKLRSMDGRQLLNLSNISNTDLRLTYGAANFPFLSACDADYMTYTQELYRLALNLHETSQDDAALQTLEYALELHTDIGNTYRLLGEFYSARQDTAALEKLTAQAEQNLEDAVKPSVLSFLADLTAESDHSLE